MRVRIVGASGKLGQYMVQHALDRGYEVVGVCREQSVEKLDAYKGRITVIPGATNDPKVIKRAVAGCDGVLVVLVPRGVNQYASGTAQAVLDDARPGAHLVFSCGWHITRDGQDVYSWKLKALVKVGGRLARLARFADLDDQVEACRRVFASDTGGPSCAAATSRRARARACPCGAGTWATPSSRATSRAAGTSPCSWWRPSRTTSSSTRPRRLSAANALGARARRQVMNASMRRGALAGCDAAYAGYPLPGGYALRSASASELSTAITEAGLTGERSSIPAFSESRWHFMTPKRFRAEC
jgi:NAD(P)-dependent dehydrogenase (short-subunit alcohol dehydrogenase family)